MHKKKEFQQIFQDWTILTPEDLELDFHYEETADTFRENALGKAQHLHLISGGYPVFADDSGIVVDALGGRPGVYSARYKHTEDYRPDASTQTDLLLAEMQGEEQRSARYVCAMAFVLSPDRFYIVQETWEGEIAQRRAGEGGFGYDPIFFLPERKKTAAELTDEEKQSISHRAQAAIKMRALLFQAGEFQT
jgi:XTP/dITP diphosphohydrolase